MCSCDPEQPHKTKEDDWNSDRKDDEEDENEDTLELRRRQADRRHFWATLGLCGSSFSMFYLILNVFPYAGFMALHLLHKQHDEPAALLLTASTIGPYAGILASSFRLGRIPTAIAWGQCADLYGRKVTLVVGLVFVILGNLWFGVASSFWLAVFIRFGTGLWNGTMVVVRTMVTEIAHGNSRLESRGVAMVSSVVGYAMLVAPAVGGLLADPLRQYPDYFERNCGTSAAESTHTALLCQYQWILEEYPFVLPNVVGSIVAVASLLLVLGCVDESLPADQLRDWRYIPTDLASWMASLFHWDCNNDGTSKERTPATLAIDASSSTNETTPLVSSLHNENNPPRTVGDAKTAKKSVLARVLDSSTNVRYFFYSMWTFAFTSLASVEAFPLFAMAPTDEGGLGLDETRIGLVQTVGGIVFVACQFAAFAAARNRLGTLRALRVTALFRIVLRLGFPLALYISTPGNHDTDNDNNNHNWWQLGYLGVLTGWSSITGSIFMGCATIGVNASIKEANQRASMNGFQSMVASLSRGMGPIVAGYLVAHAMTSETISAQASAWVVYGVLTVLEAVTYWTTRMIPEDGGN